MLERHWGIRVAVLILWAMALGACDGDEERGADGRGGEVDLSEPDVQARIERALDRQLDKIAVVTDSIEDALGPVRLLTGSEEARLRRYLNPEQLAAARRLGVPRPSDSAELQSLVEAGRLVPLPDTTKYWVVRDLDHSVRYVTPDVVKLLTRLGERFHERLDSLGLPPFRMEITSVLRTEETQEELRRVNPNAAAGVSTHEFGTTVDVAYNSFAAPAQPVIDVTTPEVPWLARRIERVANAVVETVAARRARELQAILGRELIELQSEGAVMVTLERQQPVFHMTVARRL